MTPTGDTSLEVLADRFERFEKDVRDEVHNLRTEMRLAMTDLSQQIRSQSFVERSLYNSERDTLRDMIRAAHSRVDAFERWRLAIYGAAFLFLLGLITNMALLFLRTA